MRLLQATPHLPPHQAANALLPDLLGRELRRLGHEVRFLTLGDEPDAPDVARVRRRRGVRWTRLPQLLEAFDTWRQATPLIRQAELVHIHSSTWVNQVTARLAARCGRPYVLTHYGTEIWHHRAGSGAFERMNARARHVVFYSQALLERARALGLSLREASVVYPAVPEIFRPLQRDVREALRARWAPDGEPLLLNVKRLHPTADHATLLDAFARVRRSGQRARLLVAGSGERGPALSAQALALGVADDVRFLGLVPNDEVAALQAAADVFVLSSVLEATPTVVLEALACGTPVVSTDNPGGVELASRFGDDIRLVPRSDPDALAGALIAALAEPRRVAPATLRRIDEEFRPARVVAEHLEIYAQALAS